MSAYNSLDVDAHTPARYFAMIFLLSTGVWGVFDLEKLVEDGNYVCLFLTAQVLDLTRSEYHSNPELGARITGLETPLQAR
jgi:hypothetical protein